MTRSPTGPVVMGVMALELMAGSTPRNAALTAAEASALAEKLGRDLASLVPQVRDLDLVMAAAHFDPAEALRPGWSLHQRLRELHQRAPGRGEGPRVIAFGADETGDIPLPLQADEGLRGGLLEACVQPLAEPGFEGRAEFGPSATWRHGDPAAPHVLRLRAPQDGAVTIADRVQGLPMDGVDPTYDNIASFAYPGARAMYVYVKKAHMRAIPGLEDFMKEWVKSWGKDGPLAKIGMVAMPADTMTANAAKVDAMPVLTKAELEAK